MRTTLITLTAAALLVATGLGAADAFPRGGGRRGGPAPFRSLAAGPGMLPLPLLASVMTDDQKDELREIMRTDGKEMGRISRELRKAHDALGAHVLAPGPLTAADLAAETKQIAALRDELVARALATTLKVRALLTPEQLAEVAAKKARLQQLRSEIRSLMRRPGPLVDPTD